jgi:hypothetical protein
MGGGTAAGQQGFDRQGGHRRQRSDRVSLPPVGVVFLVDGRFTVQDGTHRAAASLRCGFTHIPAILNPQSFPGDTGGYS